MTADITRQFYKRITKNLSSFLIHEVAHIDDITEMVSDTKLNLHLYTAKTADMLLPAVAISMRKINKKKEYCFQLSFYYLLFCIN